MSRGFKGTTQKLGRSPHNGNIHHPRGQRKHGRSAATSMLCWPFFSDSRGVMHHEYAPQGQTVTKEYYEGVLCRHRNAVRRKRPDLWVEKLGRSVTTMHPPILRIWFKVFWLNTTFPWFVRLTTLPTWPLVIFGRSPNWKCRWKEPDLSQEKTLCGKWQPSWPWFHKKLSRNVSSNGRTAGRSVCITEETTLKGIRVSDIQINNCIFTEQLSDTFWTDLVDLLVTYPRA